MQISTSVKLDDPKRKGNFVVVIQDWKGAGKFGMIDQVGKRLREAVIMTVNVTEKHGNKHDVALIELPNNVVFQFLMEYGDAIC